MNKQIAISGASGLIGSKLSMSLERRGYSVRRLVRTKHNKNPSDIYWNYETAEIDAACLEGMDVVIHLAGKPLDEQRWTPQVKQAICASRVNGTTLISKTLAELKMPPHLLISASATDYYADSRTPIGEEDACPGDGFVAEMCRDWEAATDPARRSDVPKVLSILSSYAQVLAVASLHGQDDAASRGVPATVLSWFWHVLL